MDKFEDSAVISFFALDGSLPVILTKLVQVLLFYIRHGMDGWLSLNVSTHLLKMIHMKGGKKQTHG